MPNTVPRIRTGTPRKVVIGGWCSGNPTEAGCSPRSVKPQRLGTVDEQPEDAVAAGQVADQPAALLVQPVVDEVGEERPRPEHAEGAVRRPGQRAGRAHDAVEGVVQVEVGADGHDSVEQRPVVGGEVAGGSVVEGHPAIVASDRADRAAGELGPPQRDVEPALSAGPRAGVAEGVDATQLVGVVEERARTGRDDAPAAASARCRTGRSRGPAGHRRRGCRGRCTAWCGRRGCRRRRRL